MTITPQAFMAAPFHQYRSARQKRTISNDSGIIWFLMEPGARTSSDAERPRLACQGLPHPTQGRDTEWDTSDKSETLVRFLGEKPPSMHVVEVKEVRSDCIPGSEPQRVDFALFKPGGMI
jgi:hypothetical protein